MTIVPSAGAGVLFTQQGTGATPGYSALDLRRADSLGLQEGVMGATDFKVVQRGAGANMSVDVTMTTGGFAVVQGDSVSGQGLYTVPVHSSTVNEVVAPADASNPRLDQVILEVQDNVHDASGGNLARTRIVPGTPTGGCTLDNRSGVAALPSNAVRLADILVPAASVTVVTANIRDRRPWARGAYRRLVVTSGDKTRTAATTDYLDSVNLRPRVECSGVPLRLTLTGSGYVGNAAEAAAYLGMWVDGVTADAGDLNRGFWANNSIFRQFTYSVEIVPAAGSHLLAPVFRGDGTNVFTVGATASTPLLFMVEEVVRQNADNS